MAFMVSHVFTMVSVMIAVAYFTLFERKVLASVQMRKGPNKVGLVGLAQPFADAVKLFTKEMTRVEASNRFSYWVAPMLGLIISLCMWELAPYHSSLVYFTWGALLFLCGSSAAVYPIILAGWASNSKYAMLGAMRAIAQTISYEVCMGLILFSSCLMSSSMDLVEVSERLNFTWMAFICPPMFIMWLMCVLAETNRAPFDFAEGESELVSGFNVEYGAVGFSMIFMAEYSNILLMGVITSCVFLGGGSSPVVALKTVSVCYFVVLARAALPRYRYDLLMYLTWKKLLPMTLSLLFFLLGVKFLMSVIYFWS
uniref:NADH-ubiquinone oxidoreductase chain 1 n=1 Tax=Nipponacmea fuscoviridis TaxID=225302 RepID=A0A6B9Q904_9GAST|nr:NADH dehydrogenase subunit 1 [Nipponacmea fuscoviridis]QHE50295.1 NADH dehydrogenase subunit 1 [Nipponacmea fuscoviridis]QVH34248.1 NADH dehydrogenase subunit 1 [Nipponacmea fuscoviridis]